MKNSSLASHAGDALDSVAHAADQALRGSQRLSGEAAQLAQRGSDAVVYATQQLRDQAQSLRRSTRGYIEHEPLKAVLIAMAAGAALLLVGSLITGGNRHRR